MYNAYFDDGDALGMAVERRFGARARAVFNLPEDASDIVAFFPALAASTAYEALRDVTESRNTEKPDADRIFERLGLLARESPYTHGKYPFLNDSVGRRLWDEKLADDERSRRGHVTPPPD